MKYLTAIILITFLACTSTEVNMDDIKTKLNDLSTKINEGKIEDISAVFDPNAQLYVNGSAMSIDAYFDQLNPSTSSLNFNIEEIKGSNDVAYARVSSELDFENTTTGRKGKSQKKGLITLGKDDDENWRITNWSGAHDLSQINSPVKMQGTFAHVVFFWLKNPDSQEDRNAFLKSLNTFISNSAHAQTMHIGHPPKSERVVVDGSFTYSLILTFDDKTQQDLYQSEPAHLKFIEESNSLWSEVIVYDSIIN